MLRKNKCSFLVLECILNKIISSIYKKRCNNSTSHTLFLIFFMSHNRTLQHNTSLRSPLFTFRITHTTQSILKAEEVVSRFRSVESLELICEVYRKTRVRRGSSTQCPSYLLPFITSDPVSQSRVTVLSTPLFLIQILLKKQGGLDLYA